MSKIKVNNPIVELNGDEMTRIIWDFIKKKLILPYLNLKIESYDLSIQNRDKTADKVTIDSVNAIKKLLLKLQWLKIYSLLREFLEKLYLS